jgi:Tfp pilus assembly protein PilN
MKNRINLYTLEMQPKLQMLSLSLAFVLWSIAGLITLLFYLYLNEHNQTLQTESATVKSRSAELSAQVASIEQEGAVQEKDQKIVDSIEQKQIFLRLKERVLDELAGQDNLKSNGFSDLMLALASKNENGVWLTHIKLNGRDISIEGATSESSNVPKWLDTLGTTEFFKGQEFAATRMSRDQEGQLVFVLSSQLSDVNAGANTDER